ncbi:MAG: PEGA domain-containing protein [Phycisphaerae bacterium]
MKRRAYLTGMLAAVLLTGCVEREMLVTSEPAGAIVYISDVEVGRTPVKVNFTWYGDYDIMLRKDGFETLKTHANLTPPIYELPPLDLLSAIAPWTYHDKRYLHFEMSKLNLPEDEELIRRAEQMRQRNLEPVKVSK